MTKQVINVGASPNSKSGDPLRTAFTKINENFTELYTELYTVPATSKGAVGDVAGTFAANSTSIYYCSTSYTNGLNDIWVKSPWTTTGTW